MPTTSDSSPPPAPTLPADPVDPGAPAPPASVPTVPPAVPPGPAAPEKHPAINTTVFRNVVALGLGAGALLAGAILIMWAGYSLPKLPLVTDLAEKPEIERFFWAALGAHLVYAIATFWFIYQILRVAERLALPLWLKDISAKDILGIETPYGASLKVLKEVVGLAKGVADDVKPGEEP